MIRRAAETLRSGGLVGFPTETVYGLGADALNPAVVARVFALKGRPATNPLIVHVADEAMARSVASAWPEEARRLGAAFWPGPLTIVVPRGALVPEAVTAGGPTVAVRVPNHSVALALLRAFGGPIVGPSANPSGRVSPTTALHVRDSFPGLLVLDGGPCAAGIESTVVEVSPHVRVLRPGILTADALGAALGQTVGYAPHESAGGPARSPGRHEQHYAPRAPAVLIDIERLPPVLAGAEAVVVLARSNVDVRPPHRLIRMPGAAAAYAAALYAALREADAQGPSLIAIERPPGDSAEPQLWLAVADRLRRATGPGARGA
jgi:L-threonylcarbamoyladenylate synthase